MLDSVCTELKNFFEREVFSGAFTIQDGVLSPSSFLSDGQYFRIIGSVFNDGVHQHPNNALTDESFVGEVWAMAVPLAVVALAEEIKTYAESDSAKPSPYASESFGGYSYSRATNAQGMAANAWQDVFAKKLNRWRKL